MTLKKLNPIALEFALHIPHMVKARQIFEGNIRQFNSGVRARVLELSGIDCLNEAGVDLYGITDNSRNMSKAITDFTSVEKFSIYQSIEGKSKRQNTGELTSIIQYNIELHCFVWKFDYTNKSKFDDQIDERCRAIIQELDDDKLKKLQNPTYYHSDTFSFFSIPINDDFRPTDFEVLEIALGVLAQSISQQQGENSQAGDSPEQEEAA